MKKRNFLVGIVPLMLLSSAAHAQQYPMVDKLADKVAQKIQASSCEDLMNKKAKKGQEPPSPMEAKAVQMMHENPGIRVEFINRVAAPIANKMFECGLIP